MGFMKLLKVAEDIRELGAILFVGAHPDDEVFTAAGIMAAAVRNGQRVGCVTATKGEKGVQDESRWPAEKLAEIRERETMESLEVLGVTQHEWLGYIDGELDGMDVDGAVVKLRAAIERFDPDTILTFGPDGLTGHPDHRTISRWTDLAVAGRNTRVLWAVTTPEQYEQLREVDKAANVFFKIDRPPLVNSGDCAVDFRLPIELTKLKQRAFELIASQTGAIMPLKPFAKPGEALARECFVEGGRGGRGSKK